MENQNTVPPEIMKLAKELGEALGNLSLAKAELAALPFGDSPERRTAELKCDDLRAIVHYRQTELIQLV
jgi:hypothetical protein